MSKVDELNKASALAEEFEALISRGSRLHADSQYLQAWEAFCAAALLNPSESTVLGRIWNMTTTIKNFEAFINFLDEKSATLSAGNLDYYAALAHERLGDKAAAMKRAQLSVDKFSNDFAAYTLLGRLQLKLGAHADAVTTFRKADDQRSNTHGVMHGMMIALNKLGRQDEAFDIAKQATKIYPYSADVWRDYATLLEVWLKKSKNPKPIRTGMLSLHLSGRDGQADLPLQSLAEELAETVRWRESFVRARIAQEIDALGRAQEFASREQLHKHAIDHCSVGTLVLEFGVASGTSLRFFGREMPEYSLFGFDSFEGLPEAWEHKDAGTFKQDALPQVETNTKLVVGWFNKTLPDFLSAYPGDVRLLHIDCDLYSSTAYVMEQLADRIVSGTVVIFDEYWRYNGWQNHEFRAMQEFCINRGRLYDIIGTNRNRGQVAVIIK
jgi:tetratricopeptide (TPR) repeat protein